MPPAQASPRHAVRYDRPVIGRATSDQPDDLQELIRRRSRALHVRMAMAEAIRALALEICGTEDSLRPADRAWLRQAIAQPVNEATEEALRVLVDELGAVLRTAPARVSPHLSNPMVTRTDFE
jgi:hypothetical protein